MLMAINETDLSMKNCPVHLPVNNTKKHVYNRIGKFT